MELGLRGKTALITGGASGIGQGIAQVLATEGVDLAIASRNPDPAVIDALVGNAVTMLLSGRVSGYIYGADLVIDGGLSLQPLPLFSADEIYNLNLPASQTNE